MKEKVKRILQRFIKAHKEPTKTVFIVNSIFPFLLILQASVYTFFSPNDFSTSNILFLIVNLIIEVYMASVSLPRIRYAMPIVYWIGISSVLITLVVNLSKLDMMISALQPHGFNIILTKTDALYFAVTTLTTTGYGDIYPVTDVARRFIVFQMLISLIFLAVIVTRLVAPLKVNRTKIDLDQLMTTIKDSSKYKQ